MFGKERKDQDGCASQQQSGRPDGVYSDCLSGLRSLAKMHGNELFSEQS